jgi:hypothetical protein
MLPTKFQFIWPNGFKVEEFLEISQSETSHLLWPSLLMDRYGMSNLYRGPSIDASYQVWFIWPNGFKGEEFLEIDQSETRIACGGHVCQ